MGSKEITMYRGDTDIITVTVVDGEGTAFDLTGYTMRFTVKNKSSDTDSLAKIGPTTATIASPLTGIGLIAISETDSDLKDKSYIYDVQITDATHNKTVAKDNFIIIDDVTDETS